MKRDGYNKKWLPFANNLRSTPAVRSSLKPLSSFRNNIFIWGKNEKEKEKEKEKETDAGVKSASEGKDRQKIETNEGGEPNSRDRT